MTFVGDSMAGNFPTLTLAKQPGAAITEKAMPVVVCILQKLDVDFEFVDVPWKRAQYGTKTAMYDGFFVASRNSTRDAYAVASVPLVFSEWVYIVRKSQKTAPDHASFKELNFAANMGTARHRWLVDKKQQGHVVGAIETGSTIENTWKMFVHNRFDVLLENRSNVDKMIVAQALEKSDFEFYVARKIPLSVYFGKAFIERTDNFLQSFNQKAEACI